MSTTTFLTLSEKLAAASSEAEKRKLSRELSSFLKVDPDFSSLVMHSLVMSVLREIPELESVLESDFFKVRHKVYQDDDGIFKVALGLAYLQAYASPATDLDERVLHGLLAALASRNLERVVNDVTVNLTQVRDGEIGSLL